MPRTYVDNAYNRRVGRVGMPVGSFVISSSSSGGGSFKTYVDNSYNRSLGRVGMPHGSMVVSRSGSSYSDSETEKTYVDNSYNRSLGRVGMPHGSMVVSRSGSNYEVEPEKTYVDNAFNKRVGRVGMPVGSHVISRSDVGRVQKMADNLSQSKDMSFESKVVSKSNDKNSYAATDVKVYKDNAMNRRLGRAGKPLGSMAISSNKEKGGHSLPQNMVYVDNVFNRRMGRVGKPRGSLPVSGKSQPTKMLSEVYRQLMKNPEDDIDLNDRYPDIPEEDQAQVYDRVMNMYNRNNEIRKWMEENALQGKPKTSRNLLTDYKGTKIDFAELTLMEKIGHGGFGDVHLAKWSGSIVAVKKLRVQRVSQKRLQEFTDEVLLFCQLDHPCIVKFLGACITTPNICIVMEYMQMSLFEALHIDEDIDFSEEERLNIIRQVSSALDFLHCFNIAHCDMKSQNVLLDYKTGEKPTAKITDFGLSMMKHESESSSYIRNIGTPRYSAPEVLRGELLNLHALKKADIYSFALVIFEVTCEEEPFYSLNYTQLKQQVGENEMIPNIPEKIKLKQSLWEMLWSCWNRVTYRRPSAEKIYHYFIKTNQLYEY